MIRLTLAVPEALIPAANELAAIGGLSEVDRNTFGPPTYTDGETGYSLASFDASPVWIETITGPLWQPEWGADLALAEQAQGALDFGAPGDDETPATPPVPSAGTIAVHQGWAYGEWIAAHLTPIEPEGL